jgi:undecaprenyl-diphosphatase
LRGCVLVNCKAGESTVSRDEVHAAFVDHDVRDLEPADIADAVDAAVTAGALFVGVAGGDGTLRAAAERLVDRDTPLLPIPMGTRNHFSRALGIEDLDGAVAASRGSARAVDVGAVNGAVFLNNATLGMYPELVEHRERYGGKVGKGLANIPAAWHALLHSDKLDLVIDGVPRRAWMLFAGNGEYGESIFDLVTRTGLDQGQLDIRVLRADRRLARLRVTAALLVGRAVRSSSVNRHLCERVEVTCRGASSVTVALDGEPDDFKPPLVFESRRGALNVLAPPSD